MRVGRPLLIAHTRAPILSYMAFRVINRSGSVVWSEVGERVARVHLLRLRRTSIDERRRRAHTHYYYHLA